MSSNHRTPSILTVYQFQVDPVLSMASVFVGMLCTFIAYVYLISTTPAYNSTGSMTPIIMAFAFLVGLQIYNIFMVPVKVILSLDTYNLSREY